MTANDIWQHTRAVPFRPFRMVMGDGKTYDIRHPDGVLIVAQTACVGGASEQDKPDTVDRFHYVDLFHVLRLEMLAPPEPTPTAASNGAA